MLETPAVAVLDDQARLHLVLGRQLKQFGSAQNRTHLRHGLAHQQGLFVPILFHESLRADAAQQSQGLSDIHSSTSIRSSGRVKLNNSMANCDNSPMEIKQHCVVGLTWTLKDTMGETLDVLEEPVEFLVGGADLLVVIEEALQGHAPGAKVDLHIEPEQGFGDFNDQLIFLEPRQLFPPDLEEGMTFEGASLPPGCNAQAPLDALYTVTDIYPEHVVLDGNHPLAGIALRLSLRVSSVREATESEIGLGSAGTGFFRVTPVVAALSDQRTLH
jgi:FKBP-type peptidyl-prolyl cis-trans isomerase SlyD